VGTLVSGGRGCLERKLDKVLVVPDRWMFCFEVGEVDAVVDTVLERACPFLGGVTGASLL
jgi:hypothetical protein